MTYQRRRLPYEQSMTSAILRDMADGVMVIDEENIVQYLNPAGMDILELKDGYLTGLKYAHFFLEDEDNDAFHQFVLDAIYDKDKTHSGIVSYKTKFSKKILKVTVSFIYGYQRIGRVGISVVFSDITESERLMKILRMKEEHEWNKKHFKKEKKTLIRYLDRMAHDSRHHIESLLGMNDIDEVRKYASKVLNRNTFNMKITGNDDIDCILWPKQQQAEEKGINFNVSGLLPDHLEFFDGYDMVTLIGNGLANAIDACQKINSTEKYIHISFRYQYNLCIQIDNTFEEAPVLKKKGWFVSTKKEPGHGFGMVNMQEVVDRYHGYMEPVIENGIFSLRIMLQHAELEITKR